MKPCTKHDSVNRLWKRSRKQRARERHRKRLRKMSPGTESGERPSSCIRIRLWKMSLETYPGRDPGPKTSGEGTLENMRITGAMRGISHVEQSPPQRQKRRRGNVSEKRTWEMSPGTRLRKRHLQMYLETSQSASAKTALAKRVREKVSAERP